MTPRSLAYSLFALLLSSFITTSPFANPAPSAPHTNPFAGEWVDQQNTSIKMSVKEEAGLYLISGGDEAYGYNLACLLKNAQAACSGHGGKLEGQNFLYQSTFSLQPNGAVLESWRAFNNLQTISGQTTWRRKK